MNIVPPLIFTSRRAHIRVKVISGAPKTEFVHMMADGVLKFRVAAVRENGKANAVLLRFLAETYGVSMKQIELVSGASESVKLIRITNL